MKVEIRKTANIISVCEVIGGEVVHVFKSWYDTEFTERKLSNYLKRNGLTIN
jgi:hypothetical protein